MYFVFFCVWYFQCGTRDICVCEWVRRLYLSARDVTKHGGRSPSPMGVNVCVTGSVSIPQNICIIKVFAFLVV